MNKEAIAAFEKVIELDPDEFDAYLMLGIIHTEKNPLLAIDYFSDAIYIAKTHVDISLAFAHRALSYAILEQYQQCFEDIEDALYLNPDNGMAIWIDGIVTQTIRQKELETLEAEGIPGSKLGVSPSD
jgi:tetratricopeptide (TPR) repeat protein